jgi:hypothetical protein
MAFATKGRDPVAGLTELEDLELKSSVERRDLEWFIKTCDCDVMSDDEWRQLARHVIDVAKAELREEMAAAAELERWRYLSWKIDQPDGPIGESTWKEWRRLKAKYGGGDGPGPAPGSDDATGETG